MNFKIIVEDERERFHVVEEVSGMYAVPDDIRMKIQIAIANAAYWMPPTERNALG